MDEEIKIIFDVQPILNVTEQPDWVDMSLSGEAYDVHDNDYSFNYESSGDNKEDAIKELMECIDADIEDTKADLEVYEDDIRTAKTRLQMLNRLKEKCQTNDISIEIESTCDTDELEPAAIDDGYDDTDEDNDDDE